MKKMFVFIISIVLLCFILSACGSSSHTYDQLGTLKRAKEKELTGAPMTKQEQNELNSYNKWEKEYNAQQYNKNNY